MTISTETIQELERVLAAGSADVAALLDVSDRESVALRSSDHYRFAQCVEEKEERLASIHRTQDQIVAALRRSAMELGCAAGEISFSTIREGLPEPPRSRLTGLADEIRTRFADLQTKSLQNAAMIRNVLSYYEFLANLIIDTFAEHAEYGHKGKADRARPIMMDRRA